MKITPINFSFNKSCNSNIKKIYFTSFQENDSFNGKTLSKRAQKFIEAGARVPFNMHRFENMDEEKFQKVLEMYRYGVSEFDLVYFLEELDKRQYEEAKKFFQAGITGADVVSFVKTASQSERERIYKFGLTGCFEAYELRALFNQKKDEKKLQEVYELASYGCLKGSQINYYLGYDLIPEILNNQRFLENTELIKKINATNRYNTLVIQYLVSGLTHEEISPTNKEGYLELISQLECLLANSEFQSSLTEKERATLDIEGKLIALKKKYSEKITLIDVDKEDIKNFAKNFLSNKENSDSAIKNFNFEQFGNKGLPLKFSREEFSHQLFTIINEMETESQKKDIIEKLEITPNQKNYDGVINFQNLNCENIWEKEIYNLCEKFFLKNEITIEDENINRILNSLIKAYPEFLNIIGKKQHNTHNLSLDIHILNVLKETLNNPDFENLSNEEKTIAKLACLFHDISKKENMIDNEHQKNSTIWANTLLEKLNYNQNFNNKVTNIISNHHWLKEYNTNKDFREIASYFSAKEDFKIARIIAEADLKSISDFWNLYGSVLKEENLEPINYAIDEINKNGIMILPTQIVKPDLIPEIYFKNNSYRVINFNNFSEDDDMSKVGFNPNTRKKDVSLLIHAALNAQDLEKLLYLSKQSTPIALSTSLITPKFKEIYGNRKFMFGLEAPLDNILTASSMNIGSGTRKGIEKINEYKTSISRYMGSYQLKSELGLNEKEYAALYKAISHIKTPSQIPEEKIYHIEKKVLTGKDIKEAILKTQRQNLHQYNLAHNEIIVEKPTIKSFIAKVNDISEIPDEYLNLCKKNNLPILIIGND